MDVVDSAGVVRGAGLVRATLSVVATCPPADGSVFRLVFMSAVEDPMCSFVWCGSSRESLGR